MALVILSISSVISSLSVMQAFAEATADDFVFTASNNEVFYMDTIDSWVILQKTSGQPQAKMFVISGGGQDDYNDIDTITLQPQQGGCTHLDPITLENPNPCGATGGTGTANCNPATFGDECTPKTGINGAFGGLWCGLTDCFVLFEQASGYSHQLQRISMVGDNAHEVSGYLNITSSRNIDPVIWGYDESTGGIGGITLWWSYDAGGGGTAHLVQTGGTSLMGNIDDDDIVITGAYPITTITGCRHCGGSATVTRVLVLAENDDGQLANRMGALFNTATDNVDFSITRNGLGSAGGGTCGSTETDSAFTGGYLGNTQNSILLITEAGLWEYSLGAVFQGCTTYANLGLVNYARGISIDTDDNQWYLYHGSGATNPSITKMNLTAPFTTLNFDSTIGHTVTGWVDANQPYNSMAVATDDTSSTDFNTLLLTGSGAKARIIYPDGFVSSGGGNTVNGVDCSLPANQHKLICALGGNATTVGVGGIVSDGIVDLGCNVIFVDCDTTADPRENGMGYLVFIASIFVVIGLFYYSIGKQAFHMPIFIWIVIIIALSAFFTITQMIDPVFLILSVIAIIALAVPKLTSTMRGSTFGSGSTE